MKTLEEKSFKVTYVVPETPEEKAEIERIIKEVKADERALLTQPYKVYKPGEFFKSEN